MYGNGSDEYLNMEENIQGSMSTRLSKTQLWRDEDHANHGTFGGIPTHKGLSILTPCAVLAFATFEEDYTVVEHRGPARLSRWNPLGFCVSQRIEHGKITNVSLSGI